MFLCKLHTGFESFSQKCQEALCKPGVQIRGIQQDHRGCEPERNLLSASYTCGEIAEDSLPALPPPSSELCDPDPILPGQKKRRAARKGSSEEPMPVGHKKMKRSAFFQNRRTRGSPSQLVHSRCLCQAAAQDSRAFGLFKRHKGGCGSPVSRLDIPAGALKPELARRGVCLCVRARVCVCACGRGCRACGLWASGCLEGKGKKE